MSVILSKRLARAVQLGAVEANVIASALPVFEMVDPTTLLIDDEYQRSLSERSLKLIRRIVGGWDWARFKPPVVARTEAGMEIIDGQHTAIAAASHPGIDLIPIMIVQADSMAERAWAFVGHNRDRLTVTAAQVHQSAVAAGDEEAMTIQQVCDRAGVKVLKANKYNGVYEVGDTMALGCITGLVSRRSAMGARKVLQVLVEAQCTPLTVDSIRGVEALVYDPQYAMTIEQIGETFTRFAPDFIEREGKKFAYTHRTPGWKGFAAELFRRSKKRGGGG